MTTEAVAHASAPALPEVMRTLLLVGRVMVKNGANASRVEETIIRIGLTCAVDSVDVYCTLTGFLVTVVRGDDAITRLLSVPDRGTDLGRLAAVDALSRDMEAHALSFDAATIRLKALVVDDHGFSPNARLLAYAVSSGAFALLLGGSLSDLLPATLTGLLAQWVFERVLRVCPEFVAIFFAALVGMLVTVFVTSLGWGTLKFVAIGMLIPLVPGMALTNALRDLIVGDLLAGLSRLAEAVLAAAALAGGVDLILVLMHDQLWI